MFIESFNYVDSGSTPTNIAFSLYVNTNTTANEPNIYTFLASVSLESITINIFFFINRLFKIGKFRPN